MRILNRSFASVSLYKKIISRMFVNISVINVMENTSGVMACWLVGIIVANLPVILI